MTPETRYTMNRRRVLLCCIAPWLALGGMSAGAQTAARPPRVVVILRGREETYRPLKESFVEGMRQAGQVEGRTVQIDFRYGGADPARARSLIRESVAESPAVLVVAGLIAARVARDATTTVPVVVATGSDLVDAGIAKSFARPGGNITGVSDLTDEAAVKRLELLKAALPNASRVVLLGDPAFPAAPKIEARVRSAAMRLGINVAWLYAKDRASLAEAFDALRKSPADALFGTD